MACQFTVQEQDKIKVKIGMTKSTAESSTNFTDAQTGMLTTKYDRLGKKIDSVFPILNPDLDQTTAITLHKLSSEEKNTFVT